MYTGVHRCTLLHAILTTLGTLLVGLTGPSRRPDPRARACFAAGESQQNNRPSVLWSHACRGKWCFSTRGLYSGLRLVSDVVEVVMARRNSLEASACRLCSVCRASRGALLCGKCVTQAVVGDTKRAIAELRERQALLTHDITAKLQERVRLHSPLLGSHGSPIGELSANCGLQSLLSPHFAWYPSLQSREQDLQVRHHLQLRDLEEQLRKVSMKATSTEYELKQGTQPLIDVHCRPTHCCIANTVCCLSLPTYLPLPSLPLRPSLPPCLHACLPLYIA